MRFAATYRSKDSVSFPLIALFDYLIRRTYDADASISKKQERADRWMHGNFFIRRYKVQGPICIR
jgi:hypothetical protein